MRETDVFPGPLPVEALRYLRSKALTPSFHHDEVWREAHAKAFTAAKATENDVARMIRDEIDRAVASGLTPEQFQKNLQPMLETAGWWGKKTLINPEGKDQEVQLGSPRRLRVIYETNLRVAHSAGQWERIQRTAYVRGWLLYELGPSENHRKEHAALAGTLLPVDAPFWQHAFPPNGWGCKCHVRQLSRTEVERRGGVTSSPELQPTTYQNKRTGQAVPGIVGIDAGWDYNPGAAPRNQPPKGVRSETDAVAMKLRERLSLSSTTAVVRRRQHEDSAHRLKTDGTMKGAEEERRRTKSGRSHVFHEHVDLDALINETLSSGEYLGADGPTQMKHAGQEPRTAEKKHRVRKTFEAAVGQALLPNGRTKPIFTIEVTAYQDARGVWRYHAIPWEVRDEP